MRCGLIGELGNVGIEVVEDETGSSANISGTKVGGLTLPTARKVKQVNARMHLSNMHAHSCFTPSAARFA
jgi:hypothetical protein